MLENKLLVATSDDESYSIIENIAKKHSFSILRAENLEEMQTIINSFKPTLIVIGMHFAGVDGVSLLSYLANINCKIKLVMIEVEDQKLLLAIKHINKAKNLNLQSILTKHLLAEEFEDALLHLERYSLLAVDARHIVNALEQNNFVLHYQPKIEFISRRLCGFEALVRLKPPHEDIIYPNKFISITEETGLIIPLTYWIIKKLFEDYKVYNNNNEKTLKFSVNISSVNLNDPVFPDEILRLAKEYNVDPRSVCFEITESGVSHQSEVILEVLTRLRIMGFFLSIDDFGTGYSSIVELQRLPFTELKIDYSFVSDLIATPSTSIIIQSMIDLGHNLGLVLVAEGVENNETMEALEKMGCDIMQGYYISRPLPLSELEKWYALYIDDNLIWHKKE